MAALPLTYLIDMGTFCETPLVWLELKGTTLAFLSLETLTRGEMTSQVGEMTLEAIVFWCLWSLDFSYDCLSYG